MACHGIAFQEPSLRVGQEGHHPRFPHYRAGCDFSSNLITMPCAFGGNHCPNPVLKCHQQNLSRKPGLTNTIPWTPGFGSEKGDTMRYIEWPPLRRKSTVTGPICSQARAVAPALHNSPVLRLLRLRLGLRFRLGLLLLLLLFFRPLPESIQKVVIAIKFCQVLGNQEPSI